MKCFRLQLSMLSVLRESWEISQIELRLSWESILSSPDKFVPHCMFSPFPQACHLWWRGRQAWDRHWPRGAWGCCPWRCSGSRRMARSPHPPHSNSAPTWWSFCPIRCQYSSQVIPSDQSYVSVKVTWSVPANGCNLKMGLNGLHGAH